MTQKVTSLETSLDHRKSYLSKIKRTKKLPAFSEVLQDKEILNELDKLIGDDGLYSKYFNRDIARKYLLQAIMHPFSVKVFLIKSVCKDNDKFLHQDLKKLSHRLPAYFYSSLNDRPKNTSDLKDKNLNHIQDYFLDHNYSALENFRSVIYGNIITTPIKTKEDAEKEYLNIDVSELNTTIDIVGNVSKDEINKRIDEEHSRSNIVNIVLSGLLILNKSRVMSVSEWMSVMNRYLNDKYSSVDEFYDDLYHSNKIKMMNYEGKNCQSKSINKSDESNKLEMKPKELDKEPKELEKPVSENLENTIEKLEIPKKHIEVKAEVEHKESKKEVATEKMEKITDELFYLVVNQKEMSITELTEKYHLTFKEVNDKMKEMGIALDGINKYKFI